MFRFLRKLFTRLTRKEVAHFIPCLPVGMKLSDGDRAALYEWLDKTIKDVMQYE